MPRIVISGGFGGYARIKFVIAFRDSRARDSASSFDLPTNIPLFIKTTRGRYYIRFINSGPSSSPGAVESLGFAIRFNIYMENLPIGGCEIRERSLGYSDYLAMTEEMREMREMRLTLW